MTAPPDYIDDPRFSKSFELPPDPENGLSSPFKVKYADFGYRNEAHPEQESVLLSFGPLMGSRLIHIAKDEIANKHKVRIINPDRPGMGGTEVAEAGDSMALWREVTVALLRHLGIQHVSLGCQSGGTVYALDMVLHHPEILHPERPYIAIGGPWILPSHTNSTVLSVVHSLPAGVIGNADKLAIFINDYLGPAIGATVGLSQALVAKVAPASRERGSEASEREGVRFEEGLMPKVMKRIYSEGVHGVSSDAVLFMQKVKGAAGWSDWGDYDALVPRLAEALRAAGRRLRVEVFYAEKDSLIGDADTKGPQWFDQCWDARHRGDVIDYHRRTVEGADHDGVWDLRWGAMQTVLEQLGQPVEQSPVNVAA